MRSCCGNKVKLPPYPPPHINLPNCQIRKASRAKRSQFLFVEDDPPLHNVIRKEVKDLEGRGQTHVNINVGEIFHWFNYGLFQYLGKPIPSKTDEFSEKF